jgi:putrescine transport system substrate-binding protein
MITGQGSRWRFTVAVLLLLSLQAACGTRERSKAGEPVQLHLYNWANYLSPTVVEQFRQETGISIIEATYPSPEVMETTLLAGHSQYDVVIASDVPLEGLGKVGVFRALDRSQLKNWNNLDPQILAHLDAIDPGNRLAVPYLWGVTGLAVNWTALRKVAPNAPTDSWKLIFDQTLASQAARCRISYVDSPEDVFDTMLIYLGKDPNSLARDDLTLAAGHLMQVRSSVTKIDSDGQISDLASGETCVQLAWTSSVAKAKRQAREAGNPAELAFVIPREGAMIYIDAITIPADSPHPREALAFIDFLMRPDVAAATANYVGGVSPNRAAVAMVDPVLRDDPSIYPPAAVVAALRPFHRRPPDVARVTTREWTRFRTGN